MLNDNYVCLFLSPLSPGKQVLRVNFYSYFPLALLPVMALLIESSTAIKKCFWP